MRADNREAGPSSPEIEPAGRVQGKQIISETYRDKRLPIISRKHYSIEMEIPKGFSPKDLEFKELTYNGKPITNGHWRNYEGYGPHVYQLRGRWVTRHRDCLKNPGGFEASWKQKGDPRE